MHKSVVHNFIFPVEIFMVIYVQLTFDAISPYNICADRLGITKTCKPWIATMANSVLS